MFDYIFICFQNFIKPYETCIFSILSSCLIGIIGILPVLTIYPNNENVNNKNRTKKSNFLLSFAVGSILGDVFLHLLPEAVQLSRQLTTSSRLANINIGILVLFGVFTFVVIEMLSNNIENKFCKENQIKLNSKQKKNLKSLKISDKLVAKRRQKTIGYLNLIVNSFDNFIHGLAVSSSFITGNKIGFLTTFSIIIHEIPHEFTDFVILLNSGFTKSEAMRAQLLTSSIGLFGAMFALWFDYWNKANIEVWVLPFTCGAFINIALVSLLPQLLRETDIWHSIEQILMIWLGIGFMAFINCF